MKNMIKLPAIILGFMLLITGTPQRVMAQDEDISLQSFYDELSPYGTWIQDSQYGYVWRPDVEQEDFRPYYTNGRWAMTEYGNTWVSNYNWGWAPFHYGRWVYNRYNQWVWIPDTVWGPSCVSWRTGGGYYGWAPMGPGMSINVNFNIPDLWWVFVPQRNIYYERFPRYYSRRNVVYINNTTIINNTYVRNRRTYYTGPRADDIRRATRQDVRVYSLNATNRPSRTNISGNNVNIYNPRPSRSSGPAAPRTVVKGNGYTTVRGDRNAAGGGTATVRPSRATNTRPNVTAPARRSEGRGVNPAQPATRPQPAAPRATSPQREERRTVAPTPKPALQQQSRPQPQQPQNRPQPQQQAQPQRPQRVQQSAPPATRSSGSSQGGDNRTESSRPSRAGRN